MDGGQVPGHLAGVVEDVLEVADPGTYHESETGSTEVDVDDRAGGWRGQVAGGQSQRQEAACHQVIYGRGRSCTEVGLHAVTVSETRSKEDRKFVGKKFIGPLNLSNIEEIINNYP